MRPYLCERGGNAVSRAFAEVPTKSFDKPIMPSNWAARLLTVNALAAADGVIIPVAPKYLDLAMRDNIRRRGLRLYG
ncbi:MAG: AAA family ATPase [Clostridiales bacterium]|nr:AAA family ATPase [Clostridiales bacterium]